MSIDFTPVSVRARRDGWTPATQRAFVEALAATRNVAAAARAVGRSWQTAYRLRARADACEFATAWDAALAPPALEEVVTGRAMGGIARPIMYRGRQVGERRRHDNRLAKYILRVRAAGRYGATTEDRPAVALDFAQALAALEADLAPHDQDDSFTDVARSSSPFEPQAMNGEAIERVADQRRGEGRPRRRASAQPGETCPTGPDAGATLLLRTLSATG